MSKFSGKCDFYDSISMRGVEYTLNNTEVYVGNVGPLKFETPEDLIPYYSHIVASAGYGPDHAAVHLSGEPYPMEYNKKLVDWEVENIQKYLRKCKRKKVEPSFEDYFAEGFHNDAVTIKELYRIITTEEEQDYYFCIFHTPRYYMEELVKEAKENGKEYHPLITNLKFRLTKKFC